MSMNPSGCPVVTSCHSLQRASRPTALLRSTHMPVISNGGERFCFGSRLRPVAGEVLVHHMQSSLNIADKECVDTPQWRLEYCMLSKPNAKRLYILTAVIRRVCLHQLSPC